VSRWGKEAAARGDKCDFVHLLGREKHRFEARSVVAVTTLFDFRVFKDLQ
jgi:hypothetical protein